ncbi:MAG: CehA/McbA family metallohydrolase [Planctomycetes bacterium]|nr:CehA/McbA family metallohydrolase [Planctomycetota bacterium]
MFVLIRSIPLSLLMISVVAAAEPVVTLRGRVLDFDTQQPVAARIYIQGADGKWFFPKSASPDGTAIEFKRQAGPTSLEQHVTLSAHPFVVDVPAGKCTITIERGKEYRSLTSEIDVGPETKEISFAIKRWIEMSRLGWYSGDVHAHRSLAEMPNLIMAEDLNVAMPLSHWVTAADTGPVTGNRVKDAAPKPEWIPVDATHGIYPLNTEYEIFTVGGKSHTLGAVLICGQKTVLDQGVPPVRRIAERAHADGAFLDLEKHSWAWTPMIVPLMKVDLFELSNNHCWRTDFSFSSWTLDAAPKYMNLEKTDKGFTEWGWIDFGLQSYYAYLNCGFRMMPSAGTGAGVHPVPFGFGRVYVHVPGEFTYEKWRTNLLAGHSFVSTGPMLRLKFNDQEAGQTFQGTGTSGVNVTGVVESAMPLDRIEIIQNGNIVWSDTPAQTASAGLVTTTLDQTISFDRSGWLIVRCFEAHPNKRIRFAHTAPVFVEVAGKPQVPRKVEVDHFVERIERELGRHTGILNPDAVDEYNEALMIYRDLLSRAR